MTMPPCTPGPATRCATGRLTAIALAVGLGLLAGPSYCAHRAAPLSAPTIALPCVETARAPLERAPVPVCEHQNAADLVGVYRAGACTLVLDASGTYRSDCSDGRRHPYALECGHVVLDGPAGAERLKVAPGRLVSETGTTYAITGGVR
jgi:hypothetical protein